MKPKTFIVGGNEWFIISFENKPKRKPNNNGNGYIPEWLEKLMGNREREIVNSDYWTSTNQDAEYPHGRLPRGQYYIIDERTGNYFMYDSKRRQIIG